MNKNTLDKGNILNNRIIELGMAIDVVSESKTTVTITIDNNKIFSTEGLEMFYSLPEDLKKIKLKLVLLLGQYQKEFKNLK